MFHPSDPTVIQTAKQIFYIFYAGPSLALVDQHAYLGIRLDHHLSWDHM